MTQSGSLQIQITGASPTGTVTLLGNTGVLASAPVVNGIATLSANSLAVGVNSLTISYSGDTNNASSLLQFSQTVLAGIASTTTTLTSSAMLNRPQSTSPN